MYGGEEREVKKENGAVSVSHEPDVAENVPINTTDNSEETREILPPCQIF